MPLMISNKTLALPSSIQLIGWEVFSIADYKQMCFVACTTLTAQLVGHPSLQYGRARNFFDVRSHDAVVYSTSGTQQAASPHICIYNNEIGGTYSQKFEME